MIVTQVDRSGQECTCVHDICQFSFIQHSKQDWAGTMRRLPVSEVFLPLFFISPPLLGPSRQPKCVLLVPVSFSDRSRPLRSVYLFQRHVMTSHRHMRFSFFHPVPPTLDTQRTLVPWGVCHIGPWWTATDRQCPKGVLSDLLMKSRRKAADSATRWCRYHSRTSQEGMINKEQKERTICASFQENVK